MANTHNLYYYDAKRIDLGKLREQAHRIAYGDDRNKAAEAIIHHHDHDTYKCDGYKHEKYLTARDENDEIIVEVYNG